TLRPAGRGEIADESANQAALVDSLMLVEAPVLRCEKCLLDVLGNVAERHPYPSLILFEHLRKAFAAPVEHDARAGKFNPLELRMIRKIGGGLLKKSNTCPGVPRRHGDFLVLAELPVCRLQVGKIDAVKSLVLARDRLWVVHGSRDEILDVDVLNVECLTHVRAARAQQLCHKFLILSRIEA